jgi:hypothetical protein
MNTPTPTRLAQLAERPFQLPAWAEVERWLRIEPEPKVLHVQKSPTTRGSAK